jgi:endonuclease YncB( thermonuclease family)
MKRAFMLRSLLLILGVVCLATTVRAATLQAKVTEVQSGNRLVVSNINRALRVHLKGVAPPEVGQPFSDAAREHLKALVLDKAVSVEYTNLSEGYLDARLFLKDVDIGSQMIRDGVAWYDPSVTTGLSVADQNIYLQCEQAARSEKRGLWADQNPVSPWDFRRAQLAKLDAVANRTVVSTKAPRPPASSKVLKDDDYVGSVRSSAGGASEKRIGFTVPAAPWTLTLPAADFVFAQKKIKPDGRYGYFYVNDGTQDINLSMFIEPVGSCQDSKSCRDMVWKNGNPLWVNLQNVVHSEIGGVSFFEFLIPSLQGQPLQQQNMYVEFVVDGFWVDIHISKVLYVPKDHELFERIIKSVKFEPKKK